jgi:hypothetical protein
MAGSLSKEAVFASHFYQTDRVWDTSISLDEMHRGGCCGSTNTVLQPPFCILHCWGMSSPSVDLTEHGRSCIQLHDSFPLLKAWSKFLKDYALNENKSVRLSKKVKQSGSKKTWVCTDDECPWVVVLSYRPEPKSTKASKLSHIPPSSWFVSALCVTHSDICSSVGSCSARQLKNTKGFKAALVEGLSCARKRVVESVRSVDGIDVADMQATVYKAIAEAKSAQRQKAWTAYKTIASWLRVFAQRNPGSRVCCQVDTHGRFYRCFLSIGEIVENQHLLIPVYEVDGAHMKNPEYNGICVLLVGHDGNKENVPLAIGFIHKETTDNFSWFFANCIAAGIALDKVALFSDRGKQLNAQILLGRIGLKISLKFCSLHIAFNVAARFRLTDPEKLIARGLVQKLQKVSTRIQFEAILDEIREALPRPINEGTADEEYVSDYLKAIHPTSWTLMGNYSLSAAEVEWLQHEWVDIPSYGEPLPLFGVKTTSGVEGQNNATLWSGLRDSFPQAALELFCLDAINTLRNKRDQACTWRLGGSNVTPYAKTLYDMEQTRRSQQTVLVHPNARLTITERFSPTVRENVGVYTPGTTRLFEVDLVSKTCTRCRVREHLLIPCRHLLAANRHMVTVHAFVRPHTESFFFPAYTLSTYETTFQQICVRMPLENDLVHEQQVRPAPLYRQAGRNPSVLRSRSDKAKRQKRIRSSGESYGNRNLSDSTAHNVSAIDTTSIQAFYADEIRGDVPAQRGEYHCSICNSTAHNAARCTQPTADVEQAGEGIKPGEYVVGESPFAACGVAHLYHS